MRTPGQRADDVVRALGQLAEGAVVSYDRDRINHGSGGHTAQPRPTQAPAGDSRPPAVVWAERIERAVAAAEAYLDTYLHGQRASTSNRANLTAAQLHTRLNKVMREYAGHDCVYVAFFEHCSVELVRRVRREMGLRVTDGCPPESNERPLTAPPTTENQP